MEKEILSLIVRSKADALVFSDMYSDIAAAVSKSAVMLDLENMESFGECIARGAGLIKSGDRSFIENEIDENALCSIVFTSGTTGAPKGVMLTQKNLMSDVMGGRQTYEFVYGPSLLTLPLYHTFAFTAGVLAMINCGVPIGISKSVRFFMRDMKSFKPQNIFLVPLYIETMYKNIWRTAKEKKQDKKLKALIFISNTLRKFGLDMRRNLFASILNEFGGDLNLIISGGAYLDEKYIEFFNDIGMVLLNGYGITECSPVVSVNHKNCIVKGSVGKLLTCNEVKIVDGEICLKGDNVTSGYYDDESATEESFENGWFKTGDLGYFKGDCLFITGRKKNLIVLSNGENVSAEELEALIYKLDFVSEVLVYDENNLIVAEIYLDKEGIPVSADVVQSEVDKINAGLPSYKNINKIKLRDAPFEKTTIKKLKRM